MSIDVDKYRILRKSFNPHTRHAWARPPREKDCVAVEQVTAGLWYDLDGDCFVGKGDWVWVR